MPVELESVNASGLSALTLTLRVGLLCCLSAVWIYHAFQLKLGPHWQLFWIALMCVAPALSLVLLFREDTGCWRIVAACSLLLALYGSYQGVFWLHQRLLMDRLMHAIKPTIGAEGLSYRSYYADSRVTHAYWGFDQAQPPAGALVSWVPMHSLLAERPEHEAASSEFKKLIVDGDSAFTATLTLSANPVLDIQSASEFDLEQLSSRTE
jgi:hypothetical protein